MDMPRDNRWDSPQDYENKISPWDRFADLGLLKGYQVIDFTNGEHIYLLTKAYQDLSMAADQENDGTCAAILKTLKFYVDKAKLSEARQLIWELKGGQASNEFINRADPSSWKVCSGCGQRKLRDTREFMRKSKSSDGLASRCKECEKAAREARKLRQQG